MRLLFTIKKLIPPKIYLALQPPYHFLLAFLAALIYGFPSRRLMVIGVTGTKGKTTVVELLQAMLAANHKTASLSSLRFKIGEREFSNDLKMTMPGRFFTQKFLHQALRAGCKYAVLEVTSEGIKQFRHRFISFDLAVLTNLAPEHLEAHGGFEKYLRAKLDLFWRLPGEGTAVINRDDQQADRFAAATGACKVFYGKKGIAVLGKFWELKNPELGPSISFDLAGQQITSPLLGEFNLYNILAALAAGLALHLPLPKIIEAVAGVSGVPGRMEFIQREPFAAVVDYAHTPDSLRKVYQTLRRMVILSGSEESKKEEIPRSFPSLGMTSGGWRLICVLGATGGGRDKWKRPEMGRIAAEFCQEVVLTNEDPYDEDPQKIMEEVASGILQKTLVTNVLDRKKAIRHALQRAEAGDTVVITGKGAEPWMMGPAGTKIAWDDRKVVREELEKIKGLA